MPSGVKEEGPQLDKGDAPEESEESASTDSGQELGAEARGLRPSTYGDRTESKAYGSIIHKCEVRPQVAPALPSPILRPAAPSHPIPAPCRTVGRSSHTRGTSSGTSASTQARSPSRAGSAARPSLIQPPARPTRRRTGAVPGLLLVPAGSALVGPQRPLLSLLTTSPLKPYGCEECGKSYRLISLLNLHKKRHSGEARYRCEDCGKLFTTSGNLKRHQLVHSGEKPYQCDYCGRSFSDPTSKMRHLETHDTDKEHKCPHCDKKFNQVCGHRPGRLHPAH